jgi:magnesium-transporting ATPase (P-type)
VLWGRAVYDNIRKFLQFQLTVNIVALVVTFVCALYGIEPPLNAVMMLCKRFALSTYCLLLCSAVSCFSLDVLLLLCLLLLLLCVSGWLVGCRG